MEDPNKDSNQTRFFLAAVLSMVALTGYSYFYAPKGGPKQNVNTAQTEQTNSNTKAQATPAEKPNTDEPKTDLVSTEDENPNKVVTIKTPLYQVQLDSKGALASSWILFVNDDPAEEGRYPLFAQGSTKTLKIPLELIPPEAKKHDPEEVPFRLFTGEEDLDGFLNSRNYEVSISDESVELSGSDTQKIDFHLTNTESGVEVTKSFVFHADSYITDVSIKATKNGEPIQNVKLLIGASIGDQGVERYTFYRVESEGIAYTDGDVDRQYAVSIADKSEDPGRQVVPGEIEWAGIGDTYFGMVLVPSEKQAGLEFRSTKYEQEVEPFYDGIIAWFSRAQSTKTKKHLMTAYVPIKADGAVNLLYTGTKDSFVLSHYDKKLTELSGRNIDIDETINYGWLRIFTKPFSGPILSVLKFLTKYTNNYGISIIIFTFGFYSLLFPLRWFSSKSMKKSQKNAPKMKALQDKMKAMQKKGVAKDAPEMRQLQMDQLKMTKDALPIGGCLPMLLQFPFLIAVYYAASIALGFRQASFLWLADLSAADPYKILPIAFAISMVLTFKFSPMAAPSTPEMKMQQNMMTYLMPIMMLWIMWSAPSGLLLYWFVGNILMFGQQMLINWLNKDDSDTATAISEKPQTA